MNEDLKKRLRVLMGIDSGRPSMAEAKEEAAGKPKVENVYSAVALGKAPGEVGTGSHPDNECDILPDHDGDAPTEPPPPGQKWVKQADGKYIALPMEKDGAKEVGTGRKVK